jgi:hypothetical protein
MTGQQVYVLNTTPTTSLPLSLIQMDIELKPYAMLPNLPSEYEVEPLPQLARNGHSDRADGCLLSGVKQKTFARGEPFGF